MIAFIDDHGGAHGVEPICKVLPIAPSSYRAQAARRRDPAKLPARAKRDAVLMPEIERVFEESFRVYGVRKVWRQLKREGYHLARCTVARLMRGMGLQGVIRGKPVTTTVSDKAAPCPLDHVNRQFKATRPNALRLSGFTYVATWSSFAYVAFIIDAYARRIVGWRVFRTARTGFVLDALEQALHERRPLHRCGLVRHSDRGSQYVSIHYTERLAQDGIEPFDRSALTRWLQRIGAERLEVLLAETLAAVHRAGAAQPKHFERVTIDTTVQPKAVTHPTDSKLIHRGVEILGRLARRHGVALRQSYMRISTHARRDVARLIHRGRHRDAERKVSRKRTWLGRLARDITRKIAGAAEAVRAAFATPLERIAQLLRQRCEDRGREKIYALHAPEVECIGKGKARTRFEFGVKVSLATTNRPAPGGQFVIGARALPGNPFDGHTLAAQIAQTERITGRPVERAYVDRGYRGHDADKGRVFVSGQKRGVTPTIRREIRRRAGIEPVIGHMKEDGHLGRNFLAGAAGDAINVILAAAGHNLRLLRAWLSRFLAILLSLLAISAPPAQMPAPQLAAR